LARRAGKAATRKARQRYVPRQPATPAAPTTTPAEGVEAAISTASAKAAGTTSSPTATRRQVPVRQAIGSELTATERSEYHYVERDLRDIGILTAVMAALLLLAWFALTATGIVA
jgi:hypothetical protein